MPAAFDKLTFGEFLKLFVALPAAIPVFTKWTKVPLLSVVEGLASPKLRAAFSALYGDAMPDFPIGGLFMMLGFMAKKSAGYPLGGSLAFARAIEAKYLALGGEIHYRSKVDRILIEDGKAIGIKGSWGESRADFVVSAADGRDTLDRMLGGIYRGCAIDRAFGELESFPSLLFIGLGLDRDCSDLPHSLSFELEEPIILEGGALAKKRLTLRTFNFDPSLAPVGKTSAAVMIETRNDAYLDLSRRPRPARLCCREEGGRRRGHRRSRQEDPRVRLLGRGSRRRHAEDLHRLYEQLARQLRGLAAQGRLLRQEDTEDHSRHRGL